MFAWFKRIFGTKNDREVKKLRPLVTRINEIEVGLHSLSDDDLRKKTADWKAELSKIEMKIGWERRCSCFVHRVSKCVGVSIEIVKLAD